MDVVGEIQRYNQGRDPERLALKFRALADNPFSFLRGTCHLFYLRLAPAAVLDAAPAAWICGDLHIENFGSYKGDNRLVYFDMNDFDEAILAPCTLEVVRLLSSILVAAPTVGMAQWSPAVDKSHGAAGVFAPARTAHPAPSSAT
ncbi:MAG: DUF2252 family protein, partial [Zoogloea sp.]|nr:DUF2252 family protein [Zoogloea sp.]